MMAAAGQHIINNAHMQQRSPSTSSNTVQLTTYSIAGLL
jgi:hypothetical protein